MPDGCICRLKKPFNPNPCILLNLVLNCIAAIQAPVILMSRNRQEEKDRVRLARLRGLEPRTRCLEGSCSIRLSYRRATGV